MTRLLVICFLVAHGFVHAAIYDMPPDPKAKQPFDPGDSWALRRAGVAGATVKRTSAVLATAGASLYAVAALGLLLDAGWWTTATLAATAVAAALKTAYFNRWLVLGLALDAGIVVAVVARWPAALF